GEWATDPQWWIDGRGRVVQQVKCTTTENVGRAVMRLVAIVAVVLGGLGAVPAAAGTGVPSYVNQWGSSLMGQPSGVVTDSQGNVYVADFGSSLVQKFTSTGTYLNGWGYFDYAATPGSFWNPYGISLDQQGNSYVVDQGHYRVEK